MEAEGCVLVCREVDCLSTVFDKIWFHFRCKHICTCFDMSIVKFRLKIDKFFYRKLHSMSSNMHRNNHCHKNSWLKIYMQMKQINQIHFDQWRTFLPFFSTCSVTSAVLNKITKKHTLTNIECIFWPVCAIKKPTDGCSVI